MKIRNPIEPVTVANRKSLFVPALAVCAIASLPWIWFLHNEAERYERLLADNQARLMRVESLTIRYSSGVKSTIAIREQQE